jgi:hypothetical protein
MAIKKKGFDPLFLNQMGMKNMKTPPIPARKRSDNRIVMKITRKQWEQIGNQMGWEPGAIVFEDAPYVDLVIGVTTKSEILKDRPNYRFPVVDPADETALSIKDSEDIEDEEPNDTSSEDREGTEMIIRSLFIVAPPRPMNPFSPIKISIPKNIKEEPHENS